MVKTFDFGFEEKPIKQESFDFGFEEKPVKQFDFGFEEKTEGMVSTSTPGYIPS